MNLISEICKKTFWEFMDGKITLEELERRMAEISSKQVKLPDFVKVMA